MVETPKWIEKWEDQRAKGWGYYVLVTGILSWGLPMFILMTFVVSPPPVLVFEEVATAAAIWGFGGALFGVVTWEVTERRYKKYCRSLSERGEA